MTRQKTILAVALGLLLAGGVAWAKDECRSKNTLGSGDAADGMAEIRVRDDGRSSFTVEVEDLLPLATYSVCVDGIRRGGITTVTLSRRMRGVGVLDFDSDSDEVRDGDADALLDFPVIGRSLEIVAGPCATGRVRLSNSFLTCSRR